MSNDAIVWACPKCKANADGPGLGFICECEGDQSDDHGTTFQNPCRNANCYACEWGGIFPKPPGKILPWEKKALEAGWALPKDWKKSA